MKKGVGLGIIILLVVLIISPVAACHLVVTTAGENEECTTCDFYTYTINVTSVANGQGDTNALVRVDETLPDGIDFVSYSDDGPLPKTAECVNPASSTLDSSCRVIRWSYTNVPHNAMWTITLKVKPIGKSDGDEVTNLVEARFKHFPGDNLGGWVESKATTTFQNEICPIPSPEFPTIAVPAGLIIGLIGALLFIGRTRET